MHDVLHFEDCFLCRLFKYIVAIFDPFQKVIILCSQFFQHFITRNDNLLFNQPIQFVPESRENMNWIMFSPAVNEHACV